MLKTTRSSSPVFAKALGLALIATSFRAARGEQPRVTYAQPPRCLVWIEGESCRDHNWQEGPADNCWAFGWAGVHGGVLDLASWRLPGPGQPFFARFPFAVPEAGEYVIYYLGRIPGVLASPLEWAVDKAPATEAKAPDGWNLPGILDVVASFKYGLAKLGTVRLAAGQHTLTFTVRKTAPDFGIAEMYSAQIDAIGIAPASWPVEPATPPTQPPRAPRVPLGVVRDDPGRQPLVLDAGKLHAELSPVNGGLRRLCFGNPGRTVLAEQDAADCLLAAERRDGTVVQSGTVTGISHSPTGLHIEMKAPGLKTTAKWVTSRDAGEMRLFVWVRNLGPTPIWRVRLDLSRGLGVRGNAADDMWLVGKEVLSPERTIGAHSWVSPCQFPFDLVAVGDPSAALYALFEDRDLLDTRVEFGRGSGPDQGAHLSFTKYPRILPNETWSAPSLVLGAYAGGDWHPAADRFSRWWYGWARTPRTPQWLASVGGLTAAGVDMHAPDAVTAALGELAQVEEVSGQPLLHTAGWFSHATECWYPLQYRLSADRLRNMRTVTDAVRNAGGRTSIYTNPLMLSRATPDYELWGRDLATIDASGRVQLTEHTTHHHPMFLPYPGAAWAGRYLQAVESAVLMGKPDMLYMDQLGAVPSHLDFTPDKHGHRHYGEWTRGSVEFLRTVTEALHARYPDLGTFIECPNPALLQYVNLSYYGTNRVLRFVFPTYYGFVGSVNVVSPEQALEVAQEALLTGEPATINYGSLTKATPAQQRAVRDIISLKRKVDPLLRQARFRDSLGLRVAEGVRATVLVGQRVAFIPFVNSGGTAGAAVTFEVPAGSPRLKGVAKAYLVDAADPVVVTVSASHARAFTLPLPAAVAGVLELR